MTEVKGHLIAGNKKFACVVSRFNETITDRLLRGARDCLLRHQAKAENITVYWVPGAFEMPLAARKIAESSKFDAIICLGAVIRGETPHFDYVAGGAASGISRVSQETGIPVIFGVLTCDTTAQAEERSGLKAGNKGWDAAMSAIEMANLMDQI